MASLFLEGELAPGTDVYLEADVSDVDRYGRLLRYTWDEPPVRRETDAERRMINARIVAAGYARAKRYPPDMRCAKEFERLQVEAAERGAGVSYLWASVD